MVVDHRGEQIIGQGNGRKVAGEMQINIFHRHHLRKAAASGATFHAKHGTERGLAQTDDGFFANAIKCITQAHGGGGFTFASWRRADRRHKDQLAVWLWLKGVEIIERYLSLVMAIGLD